MTGIAAMPARRRMGALGLKIREARIGCCAAVAGATLRGTAARRAASTTSRRTGTTSWVFGFPRAVPDPLDSWTLGHLEKIALRSGARPDKYQTRAEQAGKSYIERLFRPPPPSIAVIKSAQIGEIRVSFFYVLSQHPTNLAGGLDCDDDGTRVIEIVGLRLNSVAIHTTSEKNAMTLKDTSSKTMLIYENLTEVTKGAECRE